jgi:hypothetical protein
VTVNRIGALGVGLLAAVVVLYVALAWLGYFNDPGASPAVPTPTTAATSIATGGASPAAPTDPPPGSPGVPKGAATGTPLAVLVGAGDIADCASEGDEATAALLDAIDGTVFTLGDNAYEDGSAADYAQCYDPTWGRHKTRTMPVPGNHEYQTPGAAGYFDYFGPVAGDPREGWYAYDHGAWRIYALNSNCAEIGGCDAGSPQERWLRADLAANPRACSLAMWHHPLFSSAEHGNDPRTEDLWRALQDAGVEVVLVGHDHDYERFAPQTAAARADADRGIVEFVVGTGGRQTYPFRTIRDNSLVRRTLTFGVLRLELSAGSYAFEFIPVAGSTFTDTGSGACH